MNKIKIEVKEKHISEGIPSNCDFFNNEIGIESQEFFDAFIFDFDENRSVKPFNFNLNFDDNTFNKMKATKKQIDILKSV